MEIYVYADWTESTDPILVGTLRSSEIRGKEHFSFSYDETWLTSDYVRQIDPSLKLFVGEQHAQDDKNFKTFLDSCPDRWGRLLMLHIPAELDHPFWFKLITDSGAS